MSNEKAGNRHDIVTVRWLESVVGHRILNNREFYSEVAQCRKKLHENMKEKDRASAERLLLLYQVASCVHGAGGAEEVNIRNSFLRDARLIADHNSRLLNRLRLWFSDDLAEIRDDELKATSRGRVKSMLHLVTREMEPRDLPDSTQENGLGAREPAHEIRIAAVWGDLGLKRLVEEEETAKNVKRLRSRWQAPRVRRGKGTGRGGSRKG